MLIVTLHNRGTRQDDTADYDAEVFVNNRRIFKCLVTNHKRLNGFQTLLRAVADAADTNSTTIDLGNERLDQ